LTYRQAPGGYVVRVTQRLPVAPLRVSERDRVSGPITRGVSPCLLARMAQITGTTNNFLRPHCFSLVKKKKRESESIIVRYSLLNAGSQCQNVDGNEWVIKLLPLLCRI
jgi:hypothetical protein